LANGGQGGKLGSVLQIRSGWGAGRPHAALAGWAAGFLLGITPLVAEVAASATSTATAEAGETGEASESPGNAEPAPGAGEVNHREEGVVLDVEIAHGVDMAAVRVRDAAADAALETARDRATKPTDVETAVRLQIYLDQMLFGPGFLDGKPGKFTTKAVHAYNRSVGRTPDDWTALIEEANEALGETYATAIVPDVAAEWVNPEVPWKYSQQAELKRLSYRSCLEFMAERYHTSGTFLEELNGSAVVRGLGPRSVLKVPNIEPFRIELLEEGRTYPPDDVLSNRYVIIDTKGRNLFIYGPGEAPVLAGGAVVLAEEDHTPQKLLAMFPITPGKVQFIHHGEWAIANCFELPSWRYDPLFLKTGRRSKDKSAVKQLAPGPNLPVGILWSGLTKSGIGIHGTANPRTIGRSLSAGCIRLSNWDAARFPQVVRPGATVEIR